MRRGRSSQFQVDNYSQVYNPLCNQTGVIGDRASPGTSVCTGFRILATLGSERTFWLECNANGMLTDPIRLDIMHNSFTRAEYSTIHIM